MDLATLAAVPAQDFLASNHFSHAGTWNVLGRSRDAFSAAINDQQATWYWFDSGADRLARIMNIRTENDFQVAVLGAYYLVDFPSFRRLSSSTLGQVHEFCSRSASRATAGSRMLTLQDILNTMGEPPSGSQMQCTLQQIQALIPGISYPARALTPPSWTNRVHSECYMIGLPPYPFYGRVWYDWSRGMQVTVLVGKDDNDGVYRQRTDLFLPKGKQDGPRIHYNWKSSNWMPDCQELLGVGMPRPDFVAAGDGRCRAILKNNPYFGSIKIWSVALRQNGQWLANFWYWFTQRRKQVIFSLGPAHNLTLIEYQTFIRNAVIEPCILAQPSDLPACRPPPGKVATAQELHHFMSLTSTEAICNPTD